MKSKDLQKVGLSKYHNGDTTTKIHRDLNGGIGLRTIGTVVPNDPPSLALSNCQVHQVVHVSQERREIFKR